VKSHVEIYRVMVSKFVHEILPFCVTHALNLVRHGLVVQLADQAAAKVL